MKKFALLLVPLLAVTFLTNCGGQSGPKQYTVTFDLNGGTSEVIPAQTVKENEKVSKPTDPAKETDDLIYKFVYWELDGSEFNFDTTIKNNITLKAKWSENGEIKASWEELATTKKDTYHVGDYKYVTVNNQPHKVRIIGTKHDNLVDESGQVTSEKANYTFEFANLLSDKNGYSLTTLWKTYEREKLYAYYYNSDLRKAVDGEGTASLSWYTKGGDKTSTEYTTSALGMLPNELTSHLKMVQKNVRIYYSERGAQTFQPYNAKLFLLTHDEIDTNIIAKGQEGTTYQYYKNNNTNSARIKHQVKWHDGAVSTHTIITDKYFNNEQNFAGYNDEKQNNGGLYWLVSPDSVKSVCTWRVNADGSLIQNSYMYDYAFAIAPAFCI